MIDGSNIGKARVLQNKGQMVFHKHEFTCVDCGRHIDNPEFRIKTDNGWKWICKGCQNEITYKKGGIMENISAPEILDIDEYWETKKSDKINMRKPTKPIICDFCKKEVKLLGNDWELTETNQICCDNCKLNWENV